MENSTLTQSTPKKLWENLKLNQHSGSRGSKGTFGGPRGQKRLLPSWTDFFKSFHHMSCFSSKSRKNRMKKYFESSFWGHFWLKGILCCFSPNKSKFEVLQRFLLIPSDSALEKRRSGEAKRSKRGAESSSFLRNTRTVQSKCTRK